MEDCVFNEVYANRVRILIANAHAAGQAMGIQTLLQLIHDFDKKGIPITAQGLLEYIESIKMKPPVLDVIERAEAVIAKAEQVLPLPDNIIKFPGKHK